MKLPDFTHYEPLNRLRSLMGAKLGRFTAISNPHILTVEEIEQLARSGIEIPLDQVRILDDGTLAYKNSRVILYIRDVAQYSNSGYNLPRFHVSDCKKLQEMRANKRFDRYVVATREDGLFELNKIDGSKKVAHCTERLNVCQFCLGKLGWEGFEHRWSPSKRQSTVSKFTLQDFFGRYGKSLVIKEPTHTTETAPLNVYSDDFKGIADRIKMDRGYYCGQCGRDFSDHRQFLHAHHIDGQKSNNKSDNIKLVCIGCHADEYNHSHMKSLPEYWEFKQIFS